MAANTSRAKNAIHTSYDLHTHAQSDRGTHHYLIPLVMKDHHSLSPLHGKVHQRLWCGVCVCVGGGGGGGIKAQVLILLSVCVCV